MVVLFYLTGTVTAVAGLQYMYRGLAWLGRHGAEEAAPAATKPDETPAHRRRA
jgi:hypothetical protein